MAGLVVNQGLQRIATNASNVGVAPATALSGQRWLQTMAVDDATGAFAAANTKLNDGAGFTQAFDQALDAATTIASQTVSHVMTLAAGAGAQNFTIKRISLHDNVPGSVDGTTATLVCGVDAQTLAKTVDFALKITLKLTYTSV